ncbi:MAG: FecR domain-containing protein [Bacteroidota bacterium]
MNWEQDDTFLARWLSGELSEEERIVFEESPEGKEYIKMMNASDMIQPPSYDVNKELSKLKSTIAQEKPVEPKVVRMRPLVRLAVAASVLVILSLSIFLFTGSESFETDILQQEFVALPDGSEVQLNSSSTLAFNKRNFEDERELDLKGEAFFEVKKGVKFTVTTDNGAVEVLGTSFNVNSREERLEVICYTG